MAKCGIVGPEEYKLGANYALALRAVDEILTKIKIGRIVKSMAGTGATEWESTSVPDEIVVVSGRCPVTTCDNCGKRSFADPAFPLEGYGTCEFCGQPKKRRAGGIDILAEQWALAHETKTEIYPPEINEWNDRGGKAGFRSRNIKVAKASDIIWVVAPKASTPCKHCGPKRPAHVSNGGCWTANWAEKIGKRAIWVLV